jgi:hypothetical protein
MKSGRVSASFHLVCSDKPRNGKTLYARLLSEYLTLCHRHPAVFDASSGICEFHIARCTPVDLSSPTGQIALFDRALDPPARDHVVDLAAHLLRIASGVMKTTGFAEAARTQGLAVVVHFMVDRTLDSLLAARTVRSEIEPARLIAVRNEWVTPPFVEPAALRRYVELAKEGEVVIPPIDRRSMEEIEGDDFSFADFARAPERVAYFRREGIRAFLARAYEQFDALGLARDFRDYREERRLREPG